MSLGGDNYFQRALIFQGGGALGAYEAGTYQQIYRKAKKECLNGKLFDIVAGTSIGAINSSVLIGHYLENNSWDGSDEKLLEFWEGLMCSSIADSLFHRSSLVRIYWDNMKILNQDLADAENARRFWSIFEFAFSPRGVPNMFKSIPHLGSKFLNPFTDFLPWWKYDFTPLKNYLSKFVDFPIKTRLEDRQPRLLLTSVDIQDFSPTVVFDSYEKLHDAPEKNDHRLDNKDIYNSTRGSDSKLDNNDNSNKNIKKGRWYSEYGNSENRHLIFYDGIGVDQVLASALGKYAMNHSNIEDSHTGTTRQLWDAGYLSNTPLRELLTAHRNYWMEYTKINQKKGRGSQGELHRIDSPHSRTRSIYSQLASSYT